MLPALGVPHLEVLEHADHEHVLVEFHALAVVGGELDAALRVERHVLRAREIRVFQLARVLVELRQRGDLGLDLAPRGKWVHLERMLDGHDHELVPEVAVQRLAKLRGDAETPFRVDRVPEMSAKHSLSRPRPQRLPTGH